MLKKRCIMISLWLTSMISLLQSQTPESLESKIRAAQNPIADRTFFGLKDYTGFGLGPNDRVDNVLNIQPVIAFPLGSSWNITTRLILPVAYEPNIVSSEDGNFGLNDLTAKFYLNPSSTGSYKWGVGPTFLFPTATNDALGADKWGICASVIAEYNKNQLACRFTVKQYMVICRLRCQSRCQHIYIAALCQLHHSQDKRTYSDFISRHFSQLASRH